MATTSLSLGGHWEEFIKGEIKSGRYSSASEVVCAALRELEDKGRRQGMILLRTSMSRTSSLEPRHVLIESFERVSENPSLGLERPDIQPGYRSSREEPQESRRRPQCAES